MKNWKRGGAQCNMSVIFRTWPDATGAKRHYYSAFLSAITNVSFLTFPKLRPYLSDPDLPQTDLRQLSYSVSCTK